MTTYISKGAIAVIAAALLWGCIGPVAALYPEGSALAIAAWRLMFGAIALVIAVPFIGGWTPWRRVDLPMGISGVLSVALFSAFYFPAVQLAGVAVATVVAIGAAPLVAGVTHALHGERVSRTWIIASAIAIIGMVMVVLPQGSYSGHWLGVLLALLAAVSYSWQAHSIHQLSQRHGPVETVAVLFTGSAVLFIPFLFIGFGVVTTSPAAFAGVVFLGFFTTAVSYALFAVGVPKVGAPTAVTLSLLEPVAATAIAALIAQQIPTPLQIIGIVITSTSLIFLARAPR